MSMWEGDEIDFDQTQLITSQSQQIENLKEQLRSCERELGDMRTRGTFFRDQLVDKERALRTQAGWLVQWKRERPSESELDEAIKDITMELV